jgi:hypothetical protein
MAGRISYYGNIVKDGLVLDLDAAKRDSYPGVGTAWNDISGFRNNGTLNGPMFSSANGGNIVFDGTDDNVTTNYRAALTDFTICIWFKATDSTNPTYARLLETYFATGIWLGKSASGANSWGGGVREGSPPYGRYLTLTDGQWNFLSSIRAGTTHTLYGNGITNTTSGTVSSTALDTSYSLIIAQYIDGGGFNFKGNIGQTQIYNRALSSAEVLQNYNATKGRYL